MSTSAAEVRSKQSKTPLIVRVSSYVLIGIGLTCFIFSTSLKSVVATDTHSFTIIEDASIPVTSAAPFEYADLTREEYEREKQSVIIRARRGGDKIGAGADDAWLWVRTKTALTRIDDLNTSDFKIDVEKGVVTLNGSVNDAAQRASVEAAVKGVEGVRRVVNKLTVEGVRDDNREENDRMIAPEGTPFRKVQARTRVEQTKIEVEWPRQMNLTDKGVARVSITPDAQASATPAAELPNDQDFFFDPQRCNTPNPNLRNAYGSQYEASAVANLTATAFNIVPNQTGAKSLTQSTITFTWNIEPKIGGTQPITMSVLAQWKHKRNNQTKPECEILNRSFSITVKESIFSPGNLQTAGAVAGLLAVFLRLPIFSWNRKGKTDADKGDDKENK